MIVYNKTYSFNTVRDFQQFVGEIKNAFIDKNIEQLLITKPENEYIDILGDYKNADDINENVELIIPVQSFLKIDELYFGINYNRDNFKSIKENALQIYIEILSSKPKEELVDISHYYSKNTIKNKIKNVYADEYGQLKFILDNGYNFVFDSYYYDDLRIYEYSPISENKIDYDKFKENHFEKYDLLNQYINEIKDKYIGKKIEKIMRLGIIFEEFSDFGENRSIILDEFIDVFIDNNHLNIDFSDDGIFGMTYIGENLFDYTETSYQDWYSWRNISYLYRKNIIGQIIKDIFVEKAEFNYIDKNDKEMVERFANRIKSIKIVLENGYNFVITNDYDYMKIYQEKRE